MLYLPAGREKTTCLRLLFLDPAAAQYRAFVYDDEGLEERVDLRDYGNLDTRLEPYRRRTLDPPWLTTTEIEAVDWRDGELSFRVHGLEFARTAGSELLARFGKKRAAELSRLRCPDAARPQKSSLSPEPGSLARIAGAAPHSGDRREPRPAPVYGQVPAFAAADRACWICWLSTTAGGSR